MFSQLSTLSTAIYSSQMIALFCLAFPLAVDAEGGIVYEL